MDLYQKILSFSKPICATTHTNITQFKTQKPKIYNIIMVDTRRSLWKFKTQVCNIDNGVRCLQSCFELYFCAVWSTLSSEKQNKYYQGITSIFENILIQIIDLQKLTQDQSNIQRTNDDYTTVSEEFFTKILKQDLNFKQTLTIGNNILQKIYKENQFEFTSIDIFCYQIFYTIKLNDIEVYQIMNTKIDNQAVLAASFYKYAMFLCNHQISDQDISDKLTCVYLGLNLDQQVMFLAQLTNILVRQYCSSIFKQVDPNLQSQLTFQRCGDEMADALNIIQNSCVNLMNTENKQIVLQIIDQLTQSVAIKPKSKRSSTYPFLIVCCFVCLISGYVVFRK